MNNPQINPDDPKWTAYVLGELSEPERIEIERLIETSDDARALVDELSLAAITLKEELTPLGALAMTPEQKAAIRLAAQPTPSRFAWFPTKWGWVAAGVAAAVVLAVTPLMVMKQGSPKTASGGKGDVQVAQNLQDLEVSRDGGQGQQPAQGAPENERRTELDAEKASLKKQDQAASQSQGPRNESDERKDIGVLNQSNVGVNADRVATPPPPPPAPAPPSLQRSLVTPATGPGVAGGVMGGVIGGVIDNPALVGAATGAIRQKEEASVGEVLSVQKVAELPRVSNDVLNFIQVMPVAPAASPAAGAAAPAGGGARGGGAPGGGGAGRGGGGAGRGTGAGQQVQQGAVLGGQITVRDGLSVQQGRVALASPPPPPPPAAPAYPVNRLNAPGPNTEAYDRIIDNPFIRTTQENLATFSIDVDTASYANMRRFLTQNQLPPRDSVRIEELINYFNYDYAQPRGNEPIAPNMEVAATPWNPQSRLVRIGIKAREINADRRPPSNLVFLIDVSGSMNTPVKLPLVKAGLKMMVDRLGENDTVSIVVYAGASGLVLRPTSAIRKEVINQAIDSLQPGGSTNGASGIQLAYNQAVANFIRGGTNRVILMTDGDFNVGVTNQGDLTRLIEERAKSGVFLSVLGFGMGNIKDSTLEKLADQGNGHYAYIDNLNEARKVLVEEMGSTLVTVAKDVKIQVDFNPARVEAYRLIGYENRVLRTEDFNNDLKDAGDMGAGHTVTALFEVVPKGGNIPGPSIEPSKYTLAPENADQVRLPAGVAGTSNEMLTLRVRYKLPDASTSTETKFPLVDRGTAFARSSSDFRFAAAVAEFGMILRESPYRGNASLEAVLDLAEGSRGQDRNGYRQEFIELVQRAKRLR